MAPKCCVPGCFSNYERTIKETGYVTVFRFPTDEDKAAAWCKAIPRKDWTPSKYAVVCIKHFEDSDFSNVDVSFDSAGNVQEFARNRTLLKPNAVPRIFPGLPNHLSRPKPSPHPRVDPAVRREKQLKELEEKQNQWLEEDSITSFHKAYRTICLPDHNYARPYHSQPKKKCVEVADCNSKTSDDSSCIAGRPPVVPQGSGDDSCGSRVGQPATSYSQHHCAVYRCATNCNRMPGVTCHYFPRDERLQREWLARCRRTGEVNVRKARVCSIHFRPEDYRRDLRNELLGLPLRRKLLPTAVPTLNLPSREEVELRDVCTKKLGRLRKKLRKCDDNDEGDNMDAVLQQIVMNPPEVIIKEEPVVKVESECDSGDVGTGAQQDFEYVSVKEEPIEDLDESTSSAPEDFEYVSVKEEPIEDLDESTSSAPESYEQMGQDQELPLIIKEEIDCDDYIDPFHIS